MIIYEIPVIGETHLLKAYMDICQSFEEPWPNINTGSVVLSDYHKINFYFLDDYSKELDLILPKIRPFLFGVIGIFDWQNSDSFVYLRQLLEKLIRTFEIPVVFHGVNTATNMPFIKTRLKNGLVLDNLEYLYFSKTVDAKELINAIKKLIGLVSIQNDKFKAEDN